MTVSPFEMKLGVEVVEHLGIKLYSTVPAVLTEVVANCWDADSTEVRISLNKQLEDDSWCIDILDNGCGMDVRDANTLFLHVGRNRRAGGAPTDSNGQQVTSNLKRLPMGRKGIGKLSVFSIADVLEVHSKKKGSSPIAFQIDLNEVRAFADNATNKSLTSAGNFKPPSIDSDPSILEVESGTLVRLKRLRRQVARSGSWIRRKLAQRFPVLSDKFQIYVNGSKVDRGDLQLLKKAEYVWVLGGGDEATARVKYGIPESAQVFMMGAVTTALRTSDSIKAVSPYHGWVATAKSSGQLTEDVPLEDLGAPAEPHGGVDEESAITVPDNLNRVILMVRGRVAAEDLLSGVSEGRVAVKYMFGEVFADGLDVDQESDATTTSRQDVQADDDRVKSLKFSFSRAIKAIATQWQELRGHKSLEDARKNPLLKSWHDSLNPAEKRQAEALLKAIGRLPDGSEGSRNSIAKYAIVAFERLKHRRAVAEITELPDAELLSLGRIGPLLSEIQDVEAAYHFDLLDARLKIVKRLREATDKGAVEKVLQEILFDNLWLIDPTWRSSKGESHIETSFNGLIKKYLEERASGENLTAKKRQRGGKRLPVEGNRRFDIKYRNALGTHVIVELKRASVKMRDFDVLKQLEDYQDLLRQVLNKVDPSGEGELQYPIQAVAIVGEQHYRGGQERESRSAAFAMLNVRVMTYDQVIHRALKSYEEFTQWHETNSSFVRLIAHLDTNDLFGT